MTEVSRSDDAPKEEILEQYLTDLRKEAKQNMAGLRVEECIDYSKDHKPLEYRITFSWPIGEQSSAESEDEQFDDFGAPVDQHPRTTTSG